MTDGMGLQLPTAHGPRDLFELHNGVSSLPDYLETN